MTTITAPAGQTRQDEDAVLAVILHFFEGLRQSSAEMMLSNVLPTGHATLIRPSQDGQGGSQVMQFTLPELIERVTKIGKESPEPMSENIALATWQEGDDGDKYEGRRTEIRIDYDLAMAWTPYEVRKGDVVSHVGTNIFQFFKAADGEKKGTWMISGVADTTRQPGKGGNKV